MTDGSKSPNKAPAGQRSKSPNEKTLLLPPAPRVMSIELNDQQQPTTTPVRSRHHNNIDSIHIMPHNNNNIDNSGSGSGSGSGTPSLTTTHRFLSAAVSRAMIDRLPRSKKHTLIPVLPLRRKLSSSDDDDDDDDDDEDNNNFFNESSSTLLNSTGTATLTSISPTPNKNDKNKNKGGKEKGKAKAEAEIINDGDDHDDEWYQADEDDDDWSQLSASISEISLTGAPLDDADNADNAAADDAGQDDKNKKQRKKKNVACRLWGATKKLARRNPGGHRLGGGGRRANPLGLAGGGFDLAMGTLGKLPYLKEFQQGGGGGGGGTGTGV